MGQLDEWFKEASRITEKTKPSCGIETIPVAGKWSLRIYIPVRADSGYGGAMETGMSLLAAIGTRPENAYLELGYCVICLEPAEFYEVKALAEQMRRWLVSRAFKTSVGDCAPDAWKEGIPAHLNFEQDHRKVRTAGEWSLTVMIPIDDPKDGHRAPAAVTGLITQLGLPVEDRGPRVGGWMLDFGTGDFSLAKSKASEAIAWLAGKGYEIATSWGDVDLPLHSLDEECVKGLNETGGSFYNRDNLTCARVELWDRNDAKGDEQVRKLKRLRTRLTESVEKLTVLLTRGQVNALLDLAGECEAHCMFVSQMLEGYYQDGYYIEEDERKHYEEASKMVDPLAKLSEELRIALRRGTD